MCLGRTLPRFNCSSRIGGGCCSATKSCRTASLWTAARKASLPITVSWTWLRFMSIELVMLSNHLILCRPLLLLPAIFPRIRVFSNESSVCIRWPRYWSFSFSISPSNKYSGLTSFKIDWFVFLIILVQYALNITWMSTEKLICLSKVPVWGFPGGSLFKNMLVVWGHQFDSRSGKIPHTTG